MFFYGRLLTRMTATCISVSAVLRPTHRNIKYTSVLKVAVPIPCI